MAAGGRVPQDRNLQSIPLLTSFGTQWLWRRRRKGKEVALATVFHGITRHYLLTALTLPVFFRIDLCAPELSLAYPSGCSEGVHKGQITSLECRRLKFDLLVASDTLADVIRSVGHLLSSRTQYRTPTVFQSAASARAAVSTYKGVPASRESTQSNQKSAPRRGI